MLHGLWCSWLRVQGSLVNVKALKCFGVGFRVWGLGFGVLGLVFRAGFRV